MPCTPSAPCELENGLPWYFGLAIAIVWLAVVAGILVLGRHYLAARFSRRRAGTERDDRRALDRSTPGTDVEPY